MLVLIPLDHSSTQVSFRQTRVQLNRAIQKRQRMLRVIFATQEPQDEMELSVLRFKLDRSASMEQQNLTTGNSKRAAALEKLTEFLATTGLGSGTQLVLVESSENVAREIDSLEALRALPETGATATTADIPAMMRAGVNLSLGTDSRASVESLSIWDEIAFIGSAYRGVIDPVSLLYMATKGGSEMLNLPYGTSTLAEGSAASFQVVDTPVGLPEDELLESLVATGPQERLCAVYIDGNLWDSSVYSGVE